MNQKLKVSVIGIGIIISILISGCVEGPQQKDNSANTSSSAPLFPTQKDPNPDVMRALLIGELVLEDGCLRVDGYLLVWPHGFSIITKDEVIQVIDDNSQPIARVGDKLNVGGGECAKPCKFIAKTSAQLPSDRCPGPYWIVGEI